MSHTAQQTLPLRPAALVVIALHAGLIVTLLMRLNDAVWFPPNEDLTVVKVPVTVDPRPAPPQHGPINLDQPVPNPDPPPLPLDPSQTDIPTPIATITQPLTGGVAPAYEFIGSRPEIIDRTEIPYPTVGGIRPEGVVHLKVRIGIDGRPRVVLVDVTSGHPQLDRAALKAVGHWRFKPRLRNGVPVETWAQLPIVFRLEN